MFSASDLESFSRVCLQISDETSDSVGFVPIRNLLHRFGAVLIPRPLLVEGMLASVERPGASHQWAVLVDSETYHVTDEDIHSETVERPLPSRLRNTIAHELVHSLAFRPSEFGVNLRVDQSASTNNSALVKAIEDETERLSALLLMPDKSLRPLLSSAGRVSIDNFVNLFRTLGVSRYLLINRLNLLMRRYGNGYGLPDRLRNIVVGTVEGRGNAEKVFKKWPLFMYFDRAAVPDVVLKVASQDRLPVKVLFNQSDRTSQSPSLFECDTFVGSDINRGRAQIRLQCSIESSRPIRSGSDARSLFLIQTA